MNKAIEFLSKKDEKLARLFELNTSTTLRYSVNIFEDLVSCILDMQIRYRGTATRYKRLKSFYENTSLEPNILLNLKTHELKHINMSSQKWNALNNLSTHWISENFDVIDWFSLSDDEVRNRLIKIKGIGNWTIDMILLFSLQRSNIFPVDDLQLKKAMKKIYEIEEHEDLKKEMLYIAEDWEPYKSTAVLCLLNQNLKKT